MGHTWLRLSTWRGYFGELFTWGNNETDSKNFQKYFLNLNRQSPAAPSFSFGNYISLINARGHDDFYQTPQTTQCSDAWPPALFHSLEPRYLFIQLGSIKMILSVHSCSSGTPTHFRSEFFSTCVGPAINVSSGALAAEGGWSGGLTVSVCDSADRAASGDVARRALSALHYTASARCDGPQCMCILHSVHTAYCICTICRECSAQCARVPRVPRVCSTALDTPNPSTYPLLCSVLPPQTSHPPIPANCVIFPSKVDSQFGIYLR